MRSAVLLAAVGTFGCGFQIATGADPDAQNGSADAAGEGGTPDADPDAPGPNGDVAHLGPMTEGMLTGMVGLTIDETTMINTTTGVISPPITDAVVLPDAAQSGGPNVMVIQARSIAIDANVRVFGSRPLILVATETITISAQLDGSASMDTPGPGGAIRGMGNGAGKDGQDGTGNADSGASGASYGGPGGDGGDAQGIAGEIEGPVYGSAAILDGGSGGGSGTPAGCNTFGGSGGGAIQLTAGTSITIDSSIHVGGGGGKAGSACGGQGSSGGGGGSGGMIYLQAPMLLGTGRLGANGGGGGSSAGDMGGAVGSAGGNATVTTGGTAGINNDGDAGSGGVGADSVVTVGGDGVDKAGTNDNGGGGGGGFGRIYYRSSGLAPGYVASPPLVAD